MITTESNTVGISNFLIYRMSLMSPDEVNNLMTAIKRISFLKTEELTTLGGNHNEYKVQSDDITYLILNLDNFKFEVFKKKEGNFTKSNILIIGEVNMSTSLQDILGMFYNIEMKWNMAFIQDDVYEMLNLIGAKEFSLLLLSPEQIINFSERSGLLNPIDFESLRSKIEKETKVNYTVSFLKNTVRTIAGAVDKVLYSITMKGKYPEYLNKKKLWELRFKTQTSIILTWIEENSVIFPPQGLWKQKSHQNYWSVDFNFVIQYFSEVLSFNNRQELTWFNQDITALLQKEIEEGNIYNIPDEYLKATKKKWFKKAKATTLKEYIENNKKTD